MRYGVQKPRRRNEIQFEASDDAKSEIYKEPSYIERVDNRIYFYAEVDSEQVLKLNRNLREITGEMLHSARIEERSPASIFLHVHSYGGDMFAGFAAMDEVMGCGVPVTSIIDGAAASAATLITVSATHRVIRPHAYVLIHQISSVFWGKYSEMKDEMENMERFMDMLKGVYSTYTKVTPEMLDEILEHDLWFDADTALKYGIVDEIG